MGCNGLGSTSTGLLGNGGSNTNGASSSGGGGGGNSDSPDFNLMLVKLAEPGKHVNKGDIVAEFDRQYQLNRLDDYKATVVQLDSNLKKLRADLATAKEAHDQLVHSAKADWDKALLDLKTIEVRSAIEAEDLKLNAGEAEARYRQLTEEAKLLESSQRAQVLDAQIDRDQAKIELDRATANVDRMVVHAPTGGLAVMQMIRRAGDFAQVQQGDQIWPGQTFMQIVDPSSMVITASMNQVDAESVRLGQKARARLDAYPGTEFPAHVIGIGAITKPGAWRPEFRREIAVRLKLDQIDERVIPDLSASADIVLATQNSATLAPLNAVFHEPGSNPFVFLRAPDGWQRREVEVGLANHVMIGVRSGLSPGDVVAAEHPTANQAPL